MTTAARTDAERRQRWALWTVIAAVAALYLGFVFLGNLRLVHSQPGGYYESLTEGFLSGQTYFKVAPDPRLAELANPWAGAQGIPRIHDATYFNGRYYLYFGAAPAVCLMVPWHLLTGTYLSEAAAVWLFCAGGFAAGMLIWDRIRARCLPGLGVGSTVIAGVGLGLASYLPFLLDGPIFYHVASAAGCFWALTAQLFAVGAVLSRSLRLRAWGLFGSSTAWGLAVGSRPNCLFGLAALGLIALVLIWRERRAGHGGTWRLLTAAVAPAACIGAGLAAYNWVRFGDPAEFGIHYQFAGGDMRHVRLAGLEYVGNNLRSYLLGACDYLRYFPFVERTGGTFGVVYWAPFLLIGPLLPCTWFFSRGKKSSWVLGSLVVLSTAAVLFGSLLVYAYPVDRYALDFLPSASILAVLAFAFFIEVFAGRLRRTVAWAGGLALAYSAVHCGLLMLGAGGFEPRLVPLARMLNRIPAAFERAAGTQFGPVTGEIQFVPLPPGTREPLITTGRGRDVLFAEHVGPETVRFGFFHLGTESPLSSDFVYVPGKTYSVEFDLGSLYPPDLHPLMAGMPRAAANALHRRVEMRLDGQLVYQTASTFYPSSNRTIRVGENPERIGTAERSAARIGSIGRKGIPAISAAERIGPGKMLRLHVLFPRFQGTVGEPLVSLGDLSKGELVYATYLGAGRIRLGIDSTRGGSVESRDFNYDPAVEHVIELRSLPMAPGEPDTLGISFDGEWMLFAMRPLSLAEASEVVAGFNAVQCSAASTAFSGHTLRSEIVDAPANAFPNATGWGTVRLAVMFPQGRIGAHEPLLTTGKTGAGNFVYVSYLDDRHIRLGFDHWGIGGVTTDPIAIDFRAVHSLEIRFGALYPAIGDGWWRQHPAESPDALKHRVTVKLDGSTVLDAPFESHPSTLEQIQVGKNGIGGSTCGAEFMGWLRRI
ncbi:hypothetical protein DB347_02925 [Opitutaceae bacterium EW11]|nr:hypothetical protein DB347_02925 [Opitutaceae bacterium EW11]